MEKKYFFRDRSHLGNLNDNKSFYAAGYVEKIFCDVNDARGNYSGKDFAVIFINPFTGYIERQWRQYSDIIIIEVNIIDYDLLKERLTMLEVVTVPAVLDFDVLDLSDEQKEELVKMFTNS